MAGFKEIDPLLHSRIRLAIMSVLLTVDDADFKYLKESTGATDGNLSTHLRKLEDAQYISITKQFVGNKPNTVCQMTEKGRTAFSDYVNVLESLIHPENE